MRHNNHHVKVLIFTSVIFGLCGWPFQIFLLPSSNFLFPCNLGLWANSNWVRNCIISFRSSSFLGLTLALTCAHLSAEHWIFLSFPSIHSIHSSNHSLVDAPTPALISVLFCMSLLPQTLAVFSTTWKSMCPKSFLLDLPTTLQGRCYYPSLWENCDSEKLKHKFYVT